MLLGNLSTRHRAGALGARWASETMAVLVRLEAPGFFKILLEDSASLVSVLSPGEVRRIPGCQEDWDKG